MEGGRNEGRERDNEVGGGEMRVEGECESQSGEWEVKNGLSEREGECK
jgi:hypothetical protein